MKRHFKQKLIVLIVLFLGYLGYSLVFPILPPLFINPEFNFLPQDASKEIRMILLGLAFGMYPLGQFVGCPVIGKLSDSYGRRPLLIITLFFCFVMYLLTAIAVEIRNLPLLFFARFLTGICEGNIVIATAVMSDVSDGYAAKTKNFGWVLTFSSSAWVLGPLIGGVLASSNLVSWFTFATPFWLAGGVFFLCFLAVQLLFKETLFEKKKGKIFIKQLLFSSFNLLKDRVLRRIYYTNTYFYIATFIFFTFLPILLIKRFQFNAASIGIIESYLSVAICIAPFTMGFYRHLLAKKTMALANIGGAIGLFFVTLPLPQWTLWVFVVIPSYFIALGFSYGALLVSENASKELQGEALGLNQACQVLTEALVAILGGALVALSLYLPFTIGVISYLAAAGLAFSITSVKNTLHT